MSDLFGVPSNWAPSIDGSDEMKLSNMAADVQYKNALTQQAQMNVRKEGMQLNMMEKRLQMMAQQTKSGADKAQTIEERIAADAEMEEAMGNTAKASQMWRSLESIRASKARSEEAHARVVETQKQHEVKKADDITNILGAANNPQEWAQALTMIRAKYPDEKLPQWAEQWDPQRASMLKRMTKSGVEQLRAAAHEESEDRRDARQERTLAEMQKRQLEHEARQDRARAEHEDRVDARRKAGAAVPKDPKDPSNILVRSIQARIVKDFPKLEGDVELGKGEMVSSAAVDMANDVQSLRRSNPGISVTEATARVFNNYKKSGAFQDHVTPGFGVGKYTIGDKTSTSYTPGGKGEVKPVPMPKDPKDLKPDTVYERADGLWTYNPDKKTMVKVK